MALFEIPDTVDFPTSTKAKYLVKNHSFNPEVSVQILHLFIAKRLESL